MRLSLFVLMLFMVYGVFAVVDRTYFNYLGLKISATPEDIQKAYQSKKEKIDLIENEEERAKKSKMLKDAFDTLINEKDRQKYQRYGKDIFRTIKELTCIDKRNPENPTDRRKEQAFKMTLPVSIGEIYNGTVIRAKFPKMAACPVCQGTGAKSPKDLKPCTACGAKGFALVDQMNFYGQKFISQSKCQVCQGQGKTVTKICDHCRGAKLTRQMQIVNVTIPKGLPNGNKIVIRNMGEENINGAPSDFQFLITEIPANGWSREGNNLVYLMDISLQESLFGFTRSLIHLDGNEVAINRVGQMTTKETRHIIKEKGFVNKQGYVGNLVVRFKVTIPEFTDDQLDMWEDFFNEYPM